MVFDDDDDEARPAVRPGVRLDDRADAPVLDRLPLDFDPPARPPDEDDRDLEPELPRDFAVAMSHLFRTEGS